MISHCEKSRVWGLFLNTSVLPETLHSQRISELSFKGTEIKAGMKRGHIRNGSKIGAQGSGCYWRKDQKPVQKFIQQQVVGKTGPNSARETGMMWRGVLRWNKVAAATRTLSHKSKVHRDKPLAWRRRCPGLAGSPKSSGLKNQPTSPS